MNCLSYIGSKRSLCSTIYNLISKELTEKEENINKMSFLDLFAGTGSMSFYIQEYFKSVTANDLEFYSYIIINALLKCNYSEKLKNIINNLNSLQGKCGLISKNYSPNIENSCERMFFTVENANLCDAQREHIRELYTNNVINSNEYYFLLASLLVSIDRVANTSCVYGAYLKKYKTSSKKKLDVTPIHTHTNLKNIDENMVHNMRAEELTLKPEFYSDVVYLDPPYNQRQYAANYSPLNYIAQYDPNIILTGKTGIIENYNKSEFCSKVKVHNAFKMLFDNLKGKCKYIFLSYNNEGLISFDNLRDLLSLYGNVTCHKIPYKKFKAQMSVDKLDVMEYLWYIDTTNKNGTYNEIQH